MYTAYAVGAASGWLQRFCVDVDVDNHARFARSKLPSPEKTHARNITGRGFYGSLKMTTSQIRVRVLGF